MYIDNINMNLTLVAADNPTVPVSVKVGPNPFHDDLRISFALAKSEAISFTMTDISGRAVFNYDAGRQAPAIISCHLPDPISGICLLASISSKEKATAVVSRAS